MSTEAFFSPTAAEHVSWWKRVNKSDMIITAVLLGLFVMAFSMALGFPALAGYFPLGVSAAGAIASLCFLIRVLFFPRTPDAPKTNIPEVAKSMSEQEYEFFKSLTGRDWLSSLGWLGGFFIGLAVFGIYVALVVFTVGYLKFQAEKSWWFAAIYAACLTGLVFVAFEIALKLPLPGGLLGLA
ncbi:tripartite tricarboxylate transporter TctB family protein [Microbacterium sp. KRD172]|uniref:tripartite tricarboxylate transporter TctB family protein n=1 Tax=Microbacterium sp. KRD172 TaxID=2729727 RepID=UPI0019CF56D7|nr:tripartite tricarboxylate transporter TctB family protein [Microbacterium sp. KRD172]